MWGPAGKEESDSLQRCGDILPHLGSRGQPGRELALHSCGSKNDDLGALKLL